MSETDKPLSCKDFEAMAEGVKRALHGFIMPSPEVGNILYSPTAAKCPFLKIPKTWIESIQVIRQTACWSGSSTLLVWEAILNLSQAKDTADATRVLIDLANEIPSQRTCDPLAKGGSDCGCNRSGDSKGGECECGCSASRNAGTRGWCEYSCGPGERPCGTCCRRGYYDSHGNWVCTAYGTYCCDETDQSVPRRDVRKKYCTSWWNFCDDPMNPWCQNRYRDCKNCDLSGCGRSFREYDPDPPQS